MHNMKKGSTEVDQCKRYHTFMEIMFLLGFHVTGLIQDAVENRHIPYTGEQILKSFISLVWVET